MSTFKVSYRSKETNRRRSRHVEATSADEARQFIEAEAKEIFSIEFVPPPLASDSQREYLRAFGERRWNDSTLTKDQASDLIDQFVAKDAPTNWSFRDSYPATGSQFEKYHYFGGQLKPEFSKLTQGEMGRLIDRVRPREGEDPPNPVSPRQAMVLRFFFEQEVSDPFMRMTKSDVRLFFDAFYEENPEARKVWDSWKKTHGIPENTYLVDPATVEQNTYATLGESQLSLNCLNTFKTQRQLNAAPLAVANFGTLATKRAASVKKPGGNSGAEVLNRTVQFPGPTVTSAEISSGYWMQPSGSSIPLAME